MASNIDETTHGIAMPTNIAVLFTVLALVIPGFLIHAVMAVFTTRQSGRAEASWIYPITIGAVNVAVWSWLIYLLLTASFFEKHIGWAAAGWAVVLLVGPALIGLLLGYNVQREWTRRLLHAIGLRPVHVIPTAWDGRFRRDGFVGWILVTLTDGTQVAGFFGGRSWASSEPGERDIYLEQLCHLDDDRMWRLGDRDKGALIKADAIRFLEMWPLGRRDEADHDEAEDRSPGAHDR